VGLLPTVYSLKNYHSYSHKFYPVDIYVQMNCGKEITEGERVAKEIKISPG
jgi:hypothetical protein